MRRMFAIGALVALIPGGLAAGPMDLGKLIAPNPITDLLAHRVRDSVIKRLQLTPAQLRRMHQLVDENRQKLLAEEEELRQSHRALLDIMAAGEVDENELRAAHAAAADRQLTLLLHGATLIEAFGELLTPAQLEKAEEILAEVLEGLELRSADFRGQLAAGELLGRKWLSDD